MFVLRKYDDDEREDNNNNEYHGQSLHSSIHCRNTVLILESRMHCGTLYLELEGIMGGRVDDLTAACIGGSMRSALAMVSVVYLYRPNPVTWNRMELY